MTETLAHLITLFPRISLLPSFSLVFLDLQVKLYLLLANGAHWLQKGCRLLASSINLHGRGPAGGSGSGGGEGLLVSWVHADGELGGLEGGGLRGQLGGLLLVVEGLRDLPPERPQPLLPLRAQRLRHLSLCRRRNEGTGGGGAR